MISYCYYVNLTKDATGKSRPSIFQLRSSKPYPFHLILPADRCFPKPRLLLACFAHPELRYKMDQAIYKRIENSP